MLTQHTEFGGVQPRAGINRYRQVLPSGIQDTMGKLGYGKMIHMCQYQVYGSWCAALANLVAIMSLPN